jgi:hypothetical protein
MSARLYGRYELLDELMAYQVRPAPNDPPGKFMTGTQNHEGIAGLLGALEYFEWLGTTFGEEYQHRLAERYSGRQLRLKQGVLAAQAYEHEISRAMLEILEETPGVHLYGLRGYAPSGRACADLCLYNAGKTPPQGGCGTGERKHLRLGWQLLRLAGHRAVGCRRQWRYGSGWTRPLQYA